MGLTERLSDEAFPDPRRSVLMLPRVSSALSWRRWAAARTSSPTKRFALGRVAGDEIKCQEVSRNPPPERGNNLAIGPPKVNRIFPSLKV